MSECVTGCGRPTQRALCMYCLSEMVTGLRQLSTGGVERVRKHRVPTPGVKIHEQPMKDVIDRRPGLCEELDVTLARLDKMGTSSDKVGGSGEEPWPFKPSASEVGWVLRNTITTWARDVVETYPHLTLSATKTPEVAAWMANVAGLLAEHPAADEMYSEITDAVALVKRVIDRYAEKIQLGKCGAVFEGVECMDDLYGARDKALVRCRTCGTEHDAAARWARIQADVREHLATAAEIERAAVSIYGQKLNVKTIRTWANRGRIQTYGTNGHKEPLHKVGEVLDFARTRVALKASA
jgi:hypothetical protein